MTNSTFAAVPPLPFLRPEDEELLENVQRRAFQYFLRHVRRDTGLVADRSTPNSPASIAAMGLALTVWPVGVERGYMTRQDAATLTLNMARFLMNSRHDDSAKATGYQGFFYHFLDLNTGERAWKSELSTIDTALLIAGFLIAGEFFDRDTPEEKEIRNRARELYERIDWIWAMNQGTHFTHGWTPETGFLTSNWDEGYSEALLLYLLALGSPTYPLPEKCYQRWTATFKWRKFYGHDVLYAAPLFIHQFPQVWLDFRGLRDEAMRSRGQDYFENSRRSTLIQQSYAIENPLGFKSYGLSWGFTAGDGPGPCTRLVDGRQRTFYGYVARGVPEGIDDGTISPWCAISSIPFCPELVLDMIRRLSVEFHWKDDEYERPENNHNPTFPVETPGLGGWVAPGKLGINQGPMILMLENARTGRVWKWGARCEPFRRGLLRAGFTGGWLTAESEQPEGRPFLKESQVSAAP